MCILAYSGATSLPGSSPRCRRRDDADVELAQLALGDLARRVHHQILGALVHREEHDLADVGLAGEQHDDAVDARPTRRGGAPELEGVIMPAKLVSTSAWL